MYMYLCHENYYEKVPDYTYMYYSFYAVHYIATLTLCDMVY